LIPAGRSNTISFPMLVYSLLNSTMGMSHKMGMAA
jgi:hypothetical protein